jgi:hypothetical protein
MLCMCNVSCDGDVDESQLVTWSPLYMKLKATEQLWYPQGAVGAAEGGGGVPWGWCSHCCTILPGCREPQMPSTYARKCLNSSNIMISLPHLVIQILCDIMWIHVRLLTWPLWSRAASCL